MTARRRSAIEERTAVELAARTSLPVEVIRRIRRTLADCPSPSVPDYMSGEPYPFESADFEEQR